MEAKNMKGSAGSYTENITSGKERKSVQSPWKLFLAFLAKLQEIITMLLAIALPVLVFVQVLLRYVFQLPLMGIEEMMLFPIIWLYMIGGANASRTRSHIECGILTLYITKGRSRALFNMIRITISVAVSVWLTYWAYWYFSYSLRSWKLSPLLRYPMFFAEMMVFIGLLLMTFYTVIELVEVYKKSVRILKNPEQEDL
jgi:TRAP-type transport system small permease protein